MPRRRRRGPRRWLVVAAALVALLAGLGYTAVAATAPSISAEGPTGVSGTAASAVFTIGGRTIRQVRYHDRGTLAYRFRLANHQSFPVTISGISSRQKDARLFSFSSLQNTRGQDRFTVPADDAVTVELRLRMGGCESLSARAGSFVREVTLDTERMGVSSGATTIVLPEEIHTGSPREAFCPNSTANSRPPG